MFRRKDALVVFDMFFGFPHSVPNVESGPTYSNKHYYVMASWATREQQSLVDKSMANALNITQYASHLAHREKGKVLYFVLWVKGLT